VVRVSISFTDSVLVARLARPLLINVTIATSDEIALDQDMTDMDAAADVR
jgi:hypothetical protein